MRRSLLLAGLTVVSLVASAAGASAQSRMVQVGVLECRGGASVAGRSVIALPLPPRLHTRLNAGGGI